MRKMTASYLFAAFLMHNTWLSKLIPDEAYLRIIYKGYMNKPLDLENPNTFNEKLQWLKLHDRKSEYTTMVDKYLAKEYVGAKIGKEYIIPTYGVWDSFEDIDFQKLPEQFVLKCTHDSGGIVICYDKSKLDFSATKKKLNKSLKKKFYYQGREWPYLGIKGRIIAERYINDGSENGVQDYKIHCFNGEPRLILVCGNRFSNTGLTEDFFDINWNHLNIKRPNHENSNCEIECPSKLDEMLELARNLSKGIPFVRIDFYEIKGKVLFGEITFFPQCGLGRFVPDEWDKVLGEWITL